MATRTQATVEDLYHVADDGKAELVDGELILISLTGLMPSRAASNIYMRLRRHEKTIPNGWAIADNTRFVVNLPRRKSFSPDAAFYIGQPTGMKFLQGAPVFTVEVRSEEDYGPAAERRMAQKRADYFAAGTLVVWDVDLLNPDVVKAYGVDDPSTPRIFRKGDIADAEPAVPGWRMPVDELFE